MNTFAHTHTHIHELLPIAMNMPESHEFEKLEITIEYVRQQMNVEPCKGQCKLDTDTSHIQLNPFYFNFYTYVMFIKLNTLQSNRIMSGIITPKNNIFHHPTIYLSVILLCHSMCTRTCSVSDYQILTDTMPMSDGNCSVSPCFISIHHTYNFIKES